MLRLTLLLVLACHTATAQQSPGYSLYKRLVQQHDWRNAATAAMQIGSLRRKEANFTTATYFDSLAVRYARLVADTPLLQKAINSYTHNFVEQMLVSAAEKILIANEQVFTSNSTNETCTWYEMRAMCYFNRLRFDSAILTCRTALNVARQLPDSTSLMHLQMLLGKFYTIKLQPDSVRLVHEALQYFERNQYPRYTAQAANIIGFNYETVNSPGQAIAFYEKAMDCYHRLGDTREAMQTSMNMGDAYLAAKEDSIAKNLFACGLQYFLVPGNYKGIAGAAIRLGKWYTEAEQYDSAWFYFKVVEKANARLQSSAITFMLNGMESQLHARQGNTKAANLLMEKTVNTLLEHKNELPAEEMQKRLTDARMITQKEALENNRFAAKKLPQPPPQDVQNTDYQRLESLNWHTGGNGRSDSTDLDKGRRTSLQVAAEFKLPELKDSLKTEQQGRKNASELAKQKQQEAEKHLQIALTTTALLLLVAAGLWVQYKSRRRAERDKAQIEELQKEIHHRVTNNLGVINAMVEMAAKATATQMPAAALKTRIDSIALVHRLLYSGKAAIGKISLQSYFEALSTGIAAIFEGSKPVKITIDTPAETDSVLAEKLGLIVNELITNSFKYAFAHKDNGTIHLYARQQPGELYLTVADNGSGLPEDLKKGQGSKLIKGICQQLKGRYGYQNMNGAFFEMTVPV